MASGIVEEQKNSETSLQVPGTTQSKLVQKLLAAAENMPQFIEDLLKTQAVVVAATEAAAFVIEKSKESTESVPKEPNLRLVSHIRSDNSTSETRAAAIAAFQQLIKPCLAQGKDGAIELPGGEHGTGAEQQFCLITMLRATTGEVIAVTAVITRCLNMERAKQRLLSMTLVAGYFDLYMLRRQNEQSQIVAQSHQHVLQLATAVATAEGFESAAMNLCNELATRTGATRVALGWIKGQDVQVKALSHTEQFDKRQELVKTLEKAMEECIDQEEPVHFEPQGAGTQNVSRAAQELARAEGGNVVLTLPLRRRAEVVGAVTLEFPPTHKLSQQASTGLSVAVDLLAPQLYDRYQNDRWLITKAGLSLEEVGKKIVGPQHTLAKSLVVLGVIALVFICVYRPVYHVSSHFQFEASDKRKLMVPFDGQIDDVKVLPGQSVTKGQILVTMNTEELQLKYNQVEADVQKAARDYKKYVTQGKDADADAAQDEMNADNANANLYSEQIEQGVIRAPFDGVIISSERDLSDERNAMKKEGDDLLTIAATNSLWAKLEVSDRDIQQLRPGLTGKLATWALPTDRYAFTIDRIVETPEQVEGDNTFTVYASMKEKASTWHPGMDGEARIEIGPRPLVWIWTHKFFDYLRFKLWM